MVTVSGSWLWLLFHLKAINVVRNYRHLLYRCAYTVFENVLHEEEE